MVFTQALFPQLFLHFLKGLHTKMRAQVKTCAFFRCLKTTLSACSYVVSKAYETALFGHFEGFYEGTLRAINPLKLLLTSYATQPQKSSKVHQLILPPGLQKNPHLNKAKKHFIFSKENLPPNTLKKSLIHLAKVISFSYFSERF